MKYHLIFYKDNITDAIPRYISKIILQLFI